MPDSADTHTGHRYLIRDSVDRKQGKSGEKGEKWRLFTILYACRGKGLAYGWCLEADSALHI